MAVPMMVKMPEPMTAPIPSDVRLSHPRDFFNRTSAFSESDSSWSILLQQKSSDPTHALRSIRANRKPEITVYAFEEWTRASMYPENACGATECRRAARLLRFRKIQCWVRRVKVERADEKVMPHYRHYWPVFCSRHMVKPHGVPRYDVGVFDRTIFFGPYR